MPNPMDTVTLADYEQRLPLLKEQIEQLETLSDRLRSSTDFSTTRSQLFLCMDTFNECFDLFMRGQQRITSKDWQDIVSSFDHLGRYFQDILLHTKQSIDHLLTQGSDAGHSTLIWGELIQTLKDMQTELKEKQLHIPYQYPISRHATAFFLRHLDHHLSTELMADMHKDQIMHPLFSQFAEQFSASIAVGDIRFGIEALTQRIETEQNLDNLIQLKARLMNEYYSNLLGLKLRLQPHVDQFNAATSQVYVGICQLETHLSDLQQKAEKKVKLLTPKAVAQPVAHKRDAVCAVTMDKVHRLELDISAHRLMIGHYAEQQNMDTGREHQRGGLLRRLFDKLRGKRQQVEKPGCTAMTELRNTQAELKSRLAALHSEIPAGAESMKAQIKSLFSELLSMEEMLDHLSPKTQVQKQSITPANYHMDRARRVSADLLISTGLKQATFQFNLPSGAPLHTVPPMVRKHLQRLIREEQPERLFISGKDATLVALTKQLATEMHQQSRRPVAIEQHFDPHLIHQTVHPQPAAAPAA